MVRTCSRMDEKKKPIKTKQAKKSKWDRLNRVIYYIVDSVKLAEGKELSRHKLEVRETATGWWKDKLKLEEFIKARKIGAKMTEACYAAGITTESLASFLDVHPHFKEYLENIKEHRKLRALNTIAKNLDDVNVAFKVLAVDDPDVYGQKSKVTLDGNVPAAMLILSQKNDEELAAMEKSLTCQSSSQQEANEKDKSSGS